MGGDKERKKRGKCIERAEGETGRSGERQRLGKQVRQTRRNEGQRMKQKEGEGRTEGHRQRGRGR